MRKSTKPFSFCSFCPFANFTISFCQQNGQNGKIDKDIFHSAHSASLLTLPFHSAHSASLPFHSAHSASLLTLPAFEYPQFIDNKIRKIRIPLYTSVLLCKSGGFGGKHYTDMLT